MKTAAQAKPKENPLSGRLRRFGAEIWKNRMIYTLLIPGFLWLFLFAYMPMGGLSLAFKDFKANLGIWGSPWIGFENFEYVFRDPRFIDAVWRTLAINIGKLLVTFPFPIFLSLLLNEIRTKRYSKVLQTVFTFPHFLSWIIVSGIMINLLSNTGLVNSLLAAFGVESVNFLGSENLFVPLIYISEIWKTAGWSSIVYLAAISGIDQEQYEAAEMDGAGRIKRMLHITFPSIMPTIVIMFILAAGGLMSSGFDQMFNLSNAATKDISEVLDIYIYRITFAGSTQSATDFSISTAISLFRSVINMILLLMANYGARFFGGGGLFGERGRKKK